MRQTLGADADTFGCSTGFDEASLESFHAHYSRVSPFPAVLAAVEPGRVVVGNRYVPVMTFARTEFVNDWLLPQGRLTGSTNVKLAGAPSGRRGGSGGTHAWITTHYEEGMAPVYDDALERTLIRLRPRLERTLVAASTLARRAEAALTTTALLDREPHLALVVDAEACVLDANASAAAALDQGSPIALRRGRLVLVG